MTRVAVVGHVEWVDFVPVERFPAPGEILHARGAFTRAGGGGAVVAVALARLGAEVDFFCALGDDRLGHDADPSACVVWACAPMWLGARSPPGAR